MPTPTAKQYDLLQWKYEVAGMDFLDLNLRKEEQKRGHSYERFTNHIKEIVSSLFSDSYNTHRAMLEERGAFYRNIKDGAEIPQNWWDIATEVGKGKTVENNPLSALVNNTEESEKKAVYGALLPAYRAIKESFDKRWWFEWIFDHAKYTAERDSLKALSGLMLSLTGDSCEELDRRLENYKNEVKLSPDSDNKIKEKIAEGRKEYYSKKNLSTDEDRNDLENSFAPDAEEDDDYLYNEDVSVYNDDNKVDKDRIILDVEGDASVEIQPKISEDDKSISSIESSIDSSF